MNLARRTVAPTSSNATHAECEIPRLAGTEQPQPLESLVASLDATELVEVLVSVWPSELPDELEVTVVVSDADRVTDPVLVADPVSVDVVRTVCVPPSVCVPDTVLVSVPLPELD